MVAIREEFTSELVRKATPKKMTFRTHNNFTPYAKYGYGKTWCEQNTVKM